MNTVALLGSAKLSVEDRETFPLLALGFRSFFFLAGAAALVLVPTFLARLHGGGGGLFPVVDWHVHEMLFGFTSAVVAGFLLTAAGNWTSQRTLTGARLAALALLWILGRAALLLEIPSVLASVIDLSFYPMLAFSIGIPIFRAKSRRNYVFLGLLSLLFAANLGFHLTAHGLLTTNVPAKELTLRLYALMLCLVSGRIIPMFTRNATGAPEIRSIPSLDYGALGALAGAITVDVLRIHSSLAGALWLVAGFLGVLRALRWGTLRARASLLWVLHAGYGITVLSFVLLGLSRFGIVSESAATHLFTLGGLGLLCFGMMTRVTLGHSGRMLAAPKRMTLAFALILAAAVVRTGGPILAPDHYFEVLVSSAGLWCLSATLFLSFGVPIWFSERLEQVGNYHGASLHRVASK